MNRFVFLVYLLDMIPACLCIICVHIFGPLCGTCYSDIWMEFFTLCHTHCTCVDFIANYCCSENVSNGDCSARDWASTPSGGGDMEIQKAYLKYNLVTSSVCLRHNYCDFSLWFNCGYWRENTSINIVWYMIMAFARWSKKHRMVT